MKKKKEMEEGGAADEVGTNKTETENRGRSQTAWHSHATGLSHCLPLHFEKICASVLASLHQSRSQPSASLSSVYGSIAERIRQGIFIWRNDEEARQKEWPLRSENAEY